MFALGQTAEMEQLHYENIFNLIKTKQYPTNHNPTQRKQLDQNLKTLFFLIICYTKWIKRIKIRKLE